MRQLAALLTCALVLGGSAAAILAAIIQDTYWVLPVVTFCTGGLAGVWIGWQTRE